jgi:cytochrome c553
MPRLRAILLWFLMLAVPFQGYAAAAMAFCAPAPAQSTAGMAHDHYHHDQASPQAAEHHAALTGSDGADHHAAQSAQDDPSGAFHKCGNCAACHSLGMMPTLDTSMLHGLPQAELVEPLQAMATVSPRVPHKPPRA